MKYLISAFIYVISSTTFANDDLATVESTNAMLNAMTCFSKVPEHEIENPDFKITKELSLATSVIEHITAEMGSNENEQTQFRPLFEIAYKHCATEIEQLKTQAVTAL